MRTSVPLSNQRVLFIIVSMRLLQLRAFLILIAPLVQAQTFHGAIAGTVTDASQSAVSGAKVRAVNKDSRLTYETETGEPGNFLFANLPSGGYTVTIAKTGFQTLAIGDVLVSAARTTNYAAQLTVARQEAAIEVRANAATLETTSSSLANVVDRNQLQGLPTASRNISRFIMRLSPGVQVIGSTPSVNGSRTTHNNFQIDGADNNDSFFNTNSAGSSQSMLPLEAIDQASLVTSGSAEFGRNSGATLTFVTKSGGNAPHGSLLYFNRNEFFATHTPFQNPAREKKRPIRQHQWGGSAGGSHCQEPSLLLRHGGRLPGDPTRGRRRHTSFHGLGKQRASRDAALWRGGQSRGREPVGPLAVRGSRGSGGEQQLPDVQPESAGQRLRAPQARLLSLAGAHRFRPLRRFDREPAEPGPVSVSWVL
ncbi:MAG: TonB-dependent receptor [Acidobacteria bacterium]|nr:TonB-dependent receptor [Acidobacteriota bacterium]